MTREFPLAQPQVTGPLDLDRELCGTGQVPGIMIQEIDPIGESAMNTCEIQCGVNSKWMI